MIREENQRNIANEKTEYSEAKFDVFEEQGKELRETHPC